MLQNYCMRILEDSRIFLLTADLWENLNFGKFDRSLARWQRCRNEYSWCHKVRRVLENASMRILEESRFLKIFFAHRGPLGKSYFWQVCSKSFWLVEMHIVGVHKVRRVLKNAHMRIQDV